MMFSVGIPKEIKPFERRVGLTPSDALQLTKQEIPVLIESGAGLAAGFPDDDYRGAGARILASASELYREAQIIQKVKEPQPEEYDLLKGKYLFSFLHLASQENCRLVRALLENGVTAFAFETLVDNGRLPILEPMSRIAGSLASAYAAFFEQQKLRDPLSELKCPDLWKGMEAISGAYPQLPKDLALDQVLVFGGGNAGAAAAETAFMLDARVYLIETNPERRNRLEMLWKDQGWQGKALAPDAPGFLEALEACSVWIGCVHQAGRRAAQVVSVDQMRKACQVHPKMIMDVAIDQGGNFPESHATTYAEPLFRDSFGNIRFGVPNIPSFCGRFASEALSRAALLYTIQLAQKGEAAINISEALKTALNIKNGQIIHAAVREAHQS